VKTIPLVLCLLLSVAIGSGVQSGKEQPGQSADLGTADFVLDPEDILSVNVWKEPDVSLRKVVVRPDGKISVPLAGEIQASGLTAMQLQDSITGKLKSFIDSPNVTVSVVKVVSQSVSVVGQVSRPGSYSMGAPQTVPDILARAGGLTEYAKEKEIRVMRTENGKNLQFPVNYKDLIKGKNLKQNIVLKRGDVILVR
jgi:polysaccharide biosynthesis/export protein